MNENHHNIDVPAPGARIRGEHRQIHEVLLAGGVTCVTLILYLVALRNGFVNWDDNLYVLNNPHIRAFNLSLLRWSFLGFHVGNWHPLTWLSHALDYAFWGLNPLGHHLTNIVLHALNTFLVVLLSVKLLGFASEEKRDGHRWLSNRPAMLIAGGVTGLLFGIHPVHVESVAWISERKDVLSGFFFLLSIMSYLSLRPYHGQPGRRNGLKWYFLSLGFFVLALMSKPMAVSLPFVLLILEWYPLQRIRDSQSFRLAFFEKIPFFLLSLVSAAVTILAQKAGGTMGLMETVPLGRRIIIAARALIAYLWNMLLPVNLSPYYPYPKDTSSLFPWFFAAAALAGAVTIFCIAVARTRKLWPSAWAYYVVTLLPVIGLVQVGGQAMADRYTYLPSLAPFILAGVAAAWGLGKMSGALRAVGLSLGFLLFLGLAALTFSQIGVWNNSISLWTTVIEKEPTNASRAYTNLGSALSAEGRFDEAIYNFDKALQLDSDDFLAYSNRGSALEKTGRYEEALDDFDRAISRNSKAAVAYFNRGSTLAKMGRFERAIEDFDRVIVLDPDNYLAYNSRAAAYEKIGELDRALADLNRVIEIYPAYAQAYASKGVLYGRKGDLGQAVRWLNRSIEIEPNFPFAYFNRGVAHSMLQQRGEAMEDFTRAIDLDPSITGAYVKRGLLSLRAGETKSAVSDFRRACDMGNRDGCEMLESLSPAERSR